jgi:hypothetical protein
MINQIIWTTGLLGHFLLLIVLFSRRRAASFPWFTLLIFFYLVRSIGLAAFLRFSGHPVQAFGTLVIDVMDVLLQCAILTELTWMALRPLNRTRRITLPLLLVSSGVLVVMRLAPAHHSSLRTILALMHFLLSVLLVEWALVLAYLLRPLRLSWRSHIAAISFGFAVYSAALLTGGGYFTTGREMRDYVFFSFTRIFVYLLVQLFWCVTLWLPEPRTKAA